MDMIEEQVQAKQKAEERFGKVLAWIEAQHREPNERERAHLKKALGEMNNGLYRRADQSIYQAIEGEMSPDAIEKGLDAFTLAYFRNALNLAQNEPVKERRDFGPTFIPKPDR